MSPYRSCQLLSGAVHNAQPPITDVEARMKFLEHLGSNSLADKAMRENANKWYRIYKYGYNPQERKI